MKHTACYHLPGLFEFYELYLLFLPLFREHREYFYDWCRDRLHLRRAAQTASGAGAAWRPGSTPPPKFWP